MQKIVHLFFVVCIGLSNAVYGMETDKASQSSEKEYYTSFHDSVINRIKNGTCNHRGMFDTTPLFGACQLGYTQEVKLLLNAGVDVDPETYAGCTPLHVASQEGNFEIVKLLLAAGADIHRKNKYGNTPLQVVKKSREGKYRDTPLQIEKQKGRIEVEKLLQEHLQRDLLERKKARLAKRKTW